MPESNGNGNGAPPPSAHELRGELLDRLRATMYENSPLNLEKHARRVADEVERAKATSRWAPL
jgi:hypothetical protein